jgi:hypothetical protein
MSLGNYIPNTSKIHPAAVARMLATELKFPALNPIVANLIGKSRARVFFLSVSDFNFRI